MSTVHYTALMEVYIFDEMLLRFDWHEISNAMLCMDITDSVKN